MTALRLDGAWGARGHVPAGGETRRSKPRASAGGRGIIWIEGLDEMLPSTARDGIPFQPSKGAQKGYCGWARADRLEFRTAEGAALCGNVTAAKDRRRENFALTSSRATRDASPFVFTSDLGLGEVLARPHLGVGPLARRPCCRDCAKNGVVPRAARGREAPALTRRNRSAISLRQDHSCPFDHLVGCDKDLVRHRQAERFRGFEIDGQLEFHRLLDRQDSAQRRPEFSHVIPRLVFRGSGHLGNGKDGKRADAADRIDICDRVFGGYPGVDEAKRCRSWRVRWR
jgi:hypothetical protein